MKISTEIKYFTNRQNLIFLSFSLLLIWAWMFVSVEIDTENDRGLLTLFGMLLITGFLLTQFFSNNKLVDFFITAFYLLISGLLILAISLTLGLYISSVTKLDWTGFILPIITTGLLLFFILRRLFSFPNNLKAFWVILSLPIVSICIIHLPFYDGIFAHTYGIGFPVSVFLSFVFISISILCKEGNPGAELRS